jgi:O-antigen/teichoic acid export membrane protein
LNPIKQLAGQTAIYGVSHIVARLLNYLLVPLYTRVFVPEEYGVVTELYAYVTFLLVIFTYGLETAFFRFVEGRDSEDKVFDTAFTSIVGTSILLSGLLIAFAQPIADLLAYPQHPEYIIWFALIIGFDAVAKIPFAYLRQQERAVTFATIKIINISINIFLNLFFLVFCPWALQHLDPSGFTAFIQSVYNPAIGVGYVFIANLVASAVTLLLLLFQVAGYRMRWESALWKRMLKFGTPLLIVGLAGMVNETIDRIMLKIFLPYDHSTTMAHIGIYGACYKLSIMITLFIQAFRMGAEPFFFAQSKKEDAPEVYARVMNYFVIVCGAMFLGILVYLDVIKHFIGSQYHTGLGIVPILLMANIFLGIYYNLSVWYKLTDRTLYAAFISVGGAIVTIVLNAWLIPIIGYWGSAWATLICYTSMSIASWGWGRQFYKVPYHLSKIGVYLGLALGLYFVFEGLYPYVNFHLILKYGVATILLLTYLSVAYVWDGRKLLYS